MCTQVGIMCKDASKLISNVFWVQAKLVSVVVRSML